MIERQRVIFSLSCLLGLPLITVAFFAVIFGPRVAFVLLGHALLYIAHFVIYLIPLYLLWHFYSKRKDKPRRPCPQCDYDLLDEQTICPECGHSLARRPYAHSMTPPK